MNMQLIWVKFERLNVLPLFMGLPTSLKCQGLSGLREDANTKACRSFVQKYIVPSQFQKYKNISLARVEKGLKQLGILLIC